MFLYTIAMRHDEKELRYDNLHRRLLDSKAKAFRRQSPAQTPHMTTPLPLAPPTKRVHSCML